MASNKRPSKSSSTDRPLIRSSHGVPRVKARSSAGAEEGAPRAPRPIAARPAATPNRPSKRPKRDEADKKPRPSAPASRRGRVTLPKAEAASPRSREGREREEEKKAKGGAGLAVSAASEEAREIAISIAVAALEKKASGLEVIDVAGKVDYADFLVLMSGRSDRHVTALANAIEESLRKKNKRALAVEGLPHANWVLMDFGDVVVHVFQDDARAAYDIDGLWMDARRLPVPLDEPPPPAR